MLQSAGVAPDPAGDATMLTPGKVAAPASSGRSAAKPASPGQLQ